MNFPDIIKKNLLPIISGAMGLAGVAGLLLGISRMGGLREQMSPAEQQASAVTSVLNGVSVTGADNVSHTLIPTKEINDKVALIRLAFKNQGYQVQAQALQQNIGYDPVKGTLKRKPLLDGVFPKPERQDIPFKFPVLYKQAMDQLLIRMKSGTVPTQKEIDNEKELKRREMGLTANDTGSRTRSRRAAPTTPTAGGLTEEEQVAREAVASIAKKKAEGMKVYCDSLACLDVFGEFYNPTGRPAAVEDMWWAQLSYWIQDDIISAINEANGSAKNVLDAPVKRILKVQTMHGYIMATPDGSRIEFVGASDLQGPGSFTNLASGKYYDVLRFQVDLVMDGRKIPAFIDAMYRQSHCLMYMWQVDAFNPRSVQSGSAASPEYLYQYGDGVPLVKLSTYWETYMIRDFYHWGIVGYGVDNVTKKSTVKLYNGTIEKLDDIEARKGLTGLMPKTIRQALGSEPADSVPGAGGQ